MSKKSAAEKATETDKNIESELKVVILEPTKFNVQHKVADNLEISKLEENIIQEIMEEFKDSLEPGQEKSQFVKALIRIFIILLNTKFSSITKVKKIIRASAKLALEVWPELRQQSGE